MNPTNTDPQAVLRALRDLKEQLFKDEVVEEILTLSTEERIAFTKKRLALGEEILRLEAAQLKEIRESMEKELANLAEGVGDLTNSLRKLERVTEWTRAVGDVISLCQKIVA